MATAPLPFLAAMPTPSPTAMSLPAAAPAVPPPPQVFGRDATRLVEPWQTSPASIASPPASDIAPPANIPAGGPAQPRSAAAPPAARTATGAKGVAAAGAVIDPVDSGNGQSTSVGGGGSGRPSATPVVASIGAPSVPAVDAAVSLIARPVHADRRVALSPAGTLAPPLATAPPPAAPLPPAAASLPAAPPRPTVAPPENALPTKPVVVRAAAVGEPVDRLEAPVAVGVTPGPVFAPPVGPASNAAAALPPPPTAPSRDTPLPGFAVDTAALGAVGAEVSHRADGGNGLHVHFAVDRGATAALIAGAGDGLDRALAAAGARLDTVSVAVRDEAAGPGDGFAAPDQRGGETRHDAPARQPQPPRRAAPTPVTSDRFA